MPRLLVAFVADDAFDLESKEEAIYALQSQRTNSSFEISYETLLQLREDQKASETSLREAARYADVNTEAGRKIIESLAQAEKRVATSRGLVDRLNNIIPGIARPATDASAAKAQEVFTTPELLENILAFSKPSDILTAMRVQRCFEDTVLGSIHLKRRLGLAPFDDKHYYSPLSARHFSASRDLESSSLRD